MELKAYFELVQKKVNACMESKLNKLASEPQDLKKAMQYALLLGGKRARPLLVYATAKSFGYDNYNIDCVAASIECIHAYSLIHDDMPEMDNDLMRRGMPTVHAKFGSACALLAGDTLQALAYDFILQESCTLSSEVKVLLCRALANASGFNGMCGGQAMDLSSENKQLTQEELELLHHKKTGALIEAAVNMGFIASRLEEAYQNEHSDIIGFNLGHNSAPKIQREFNALHEYAQKIGLAFQVWDDVLDVAGNSELLGKNVGSDEAHNKSTFVSLLGLEKAKHYAQQLALEAIAFLDDVNEDVDILKQFAHFAVERDH